MICWRHLFTCSYNHNGGLEHIPIRTKNDRHLVPIHTRIIVNEWIILQSMHKVFSRTSNTEYVDFWCVYSGVMSVIMMRWNEIHEQPWQCSDWVKCTNTNPNTGSRQSVKVSKKRCKTIETTLFLFFCFFHTFLSFLSLMPFPFVVEYDRWSRSFFNNNKKCHQSEMK